jgi:hypothetical protein
VASGDKEFEIESFTATDGLDRKLYTSTAFTIGLFTVAEKLIFNLPSITVTSILNINEF